MRQMHFFFIKWHINLRGLFNAKASLMVIIKLIAEGDKVVHTFPEGISLKINVIVGLPFQLAYFEATVQHFSHNAN